MAFHVDFLFLPMKCHRLVRVLKRLIHQLASLWCVMCNTYLISVLSWLLSASVKTKASSVVLLVAEGRTLTFNGVGWMDIILQESCEYFIERFWKVGGGGERKHTYSGASLFPMSFASVTPRTLRPHISGVSVGAFSVLRKRHKWN